MTLPPTLPGLSPAALATPALATPAPLPSPTRDLAVALAQLQTSGVCIIPDALDAQTLARVREAIYRAAEADAHAETFAGRAQQRFGLDRDDRNVRVWNLLNRDPVFVALAEHALALQLVRATLGWPALLSNISGNITRPGAAAGVLHADQIFVPEPWPAAAQGVNIAWCIDDFTVANGATRVSVGSHLLNRAPTAADQADGLLPAVAAAGSLVAFESRIWHRAGANTTSDGTRAAVFAFYSTPIYRTQENWFLSLNAGVTDTASDTLLTLLAYQSQGFGLVYGRSPR